MSYSKICFFCLSSNDMELLEKEAIPEIITFCLGVDYHSRETDFPIIDKDTWLPINLGTKLVHIILTSDWRFLLQAFTSLMPPPTCHSLLSLSFSAYYYFWIMGDTDKQQQWTENLSFPWTAQFCEICVKVVVSMNSVSLEPNVCGVWLKWQVFWALCIVEDAWIGGGSGTGPKTTAGQRLEWPVMDNLIVPGKNAILQPLLFWKNPKVEYNMDLWCLGG